MQAKGEFRPRMQARTRALRTLAPLAFRRFAGAIADVWSVRGETGGGGFYVAPDPRIVVFLPPERGTAEGADPVSHMAMRTDRDIRDHHNLQAIYIPAGVPLWSRLDAAQDMRHLDFHLEAPALQQRLQAGGQRVDLTQPRMITAGSSGPALADLAWQAAEEVTTPRQPEAQLDNLFCGILRQIFDAPTAVQAPVAGGLAPWQFTAVERHLRANLNRHVSVAELAQVAGISESWFAHSFKQSRNETPQHWQARIRLEAACQMMQDPRLSLAEIAHTAGFADQAHLSRQFRTYYGAPPSVWRQRRQAG